LANPGGGNVPRELIYRCKHFRREMRGLNVPSDISVSVCGTDLVRLPDGSLAALEDNLRVPSDPESHLFQCALGEWTTRLTLRKLIRRLTMRCGRVACQDFAHIMIALVRQLEIPCRYVSGYLFHQ
jgi:hypothetical protein